ncbi:MAG TPA: nucleotidyltransferase family protein [Jatrophihabitans sp.]|nr:nucleotidyltransferase family protein [Jatrophihabitans sp.]
MAQPSDSIEWRFLESACRLPAPEAATELETLLRDKSLDVVALVAYAAHHKLLPYLARVLNLTSMPVLPPLLANVLVLHAANSYKAKQLTQTTAALCEQLAAEGVTVAVTKGLALHHTLYQADGTRYFTDVDLMIKPADAPVTARTLAAQGYQVGRCNRQRQDVTPLESAELLVYSLSPDHLPKSALPLADPFLPAVAIDVAFSLTWAAAPWSVPMDDALAGCRTIPADSTQLPVLADDFHFLFLILHLFREAWHESSMDKINLAQFRDIAGFAELLQPTGLQRVRDLVRGYRLEEPVSWVLGHLEQLFDVSIAAQLCAGSPRESWLQTVKLRRGEVGRWSGDMRERLFQGRNSILGRAGYEPGA